MKATIQKWGNSLALRIPSALAKCVSLRQDSIVDLSTENGAILVKPVPKRAISLAKLLKKITPGNLHVKQDTGDPVGAGSW